MFYKCTEVRRKVNGSIDRVLQRFSWATQVTKDPSSPTFFTPSVDTQAYPRKDPSPLSQLGFTLNEELKRTVYSPPYVAKDHRGPPQGPVENPQTSSIGSPPAFCAEPR